MTKAAALALIDEEKNREQMVSMKREALTHYVFCKEYLSLFR